VDLQAAAVLPVSDAGAGFRAQPKAQALLGLVFDGQTSAEMDSTALPILPAIHARRQRLFWPVVFDVATVGADLPAAVFEAALVLHTEPASNPKGCVACRGYQQRFAI